MMQMGSISQSGNPFDCGVIIILPEAVSSSDCLSDKLTDGAAGSVADAVTETDGETDGVSSAEGTSIASVTAEISV